MECFIRSCEQFEDYPSNLVRPETLSRNLKAYSKRLISEKHLLFCDQQLYAARPSDRQSAVDFIDIDGQSDPHSERVTDLVSLKQLLRSALRPGISDPLCRFIFIHARHSRAPLSIAHDMLKFVFTYHQIPPSFLDFIFPFGNQINARDSYFSGLRDESRIDAASHDLEIPQLLRTGEELRLCYNLRSVEPSWSDPELPWSIRQCAIYHSFDHQTGKSLWVTIKGNELIKKRIEEEETLPSLSQAKSRSENYGSTLDVHLILCDWSGENWRLYINDLEDKVRKLAPGAIAIPVEKPRTPPSPPKNALRSPTQRMDSFPSTVQSPISPRSRSGTFSSFFPSRSTTIMADSKSILPISEGDRYDKSEPTTTDKNAIQKSLAALSKIMNNTCIGSGKAYKDSRTSQPLSSSNEKSSSSPVDKSTPFVDRPTPPERPPNWVQSDSDKPHESFNIEDLQHAEYLEEKLHDASMHLKLNDSVLEELRSFYRSAAAHADFPSDIKIECAVRQANFDRCVHGVIKDMRMLQSRIETLLQLLVNRKHLLNCILQHQSTKANESFAKKAHDSARFMEAMTVEMHSIAKKTERETVSMRAITSVTLFFLPATFLASFMSTDILDFKDGKQDLQMAGLKIYLAIALPATFFTFVAWYYISWAAKKTSEPIADSAEGEQRWLHAV
ncbi:hypothetical protein BU23DRAFT_93257 [Bimuria novae-zelandiae CBS 107.79]|uniref:CorA-like transporter domain-containing protein n=1 Tax=Bimuria novae-zelandiae CBS 107.79 TaxID=1447943 RepID=A0A6A5VBS9_9PLEO|nr:hypothetical protein BU23DRAFT_93257 [Bimuria novae-zelandiae CBS 107.79]